MPYKDPEKQKEAMRNIMRERRAEKRKGRKFVKDRVKQFFAAIGRDVAMGNDSFEALCNWLRPKFQTALWAVARSNDKKSYLYHDDMIQAISKSTSSRQAVGLAQALAHVDGRFIFVAEWIINLEDLTDNPNDFELQYENESFKVLLESMKEGSQPKPPDHSPGGTLLFSRVAKQAEGRVYYEKKRSEKHE